MSSVFIVILILVVTCWRSEPLFFRDELDLSFKDGVKYKGDIYVPEGLLEIRCVIKKSYEGNLIASDLELKCNNEKVQLEISDNQTAVYRKENATLNDSAVYTCSLPKTDIKSFFLVKIIKLLSVPTVECKAYNFKRITCSWVSNPDTDCMLGYTKSLDEFDNTQYYNCKKRENAKDICDIDTVYPIYPTYYFLMSCKNIFTTTNTSFQNDLKDIALMDPVKSVLFSNNSTSELYLKWKSPFEHGSVPLVYLVKYKCDWPICRWHSRNVSDTGVYLKDLYPFGRYSIILSVRVRDGKLDSQPYKTIHSMPSDVPAANAMITGYHNMQSTALTRNIVLYFTPPMPHQARGPISSMEHRVVLRSMSGHLDKNITNIDGKKTSVSFDRLYMSEDYHVVMKMVSPFGINETLADSEFLIPKVNANESPFLQVYAQAMSNDRLNIIVQLNWDYKKGYVADSFRLYWCEGRLVTKTCTGLLHYLDVTGVKVFNITLPESYEKYLYGVSGVHGGRYSSITWSPCNYLANKGPRKEPHVNISPGVKSLSLNIVPYDCKESEGKVTGFDLKYYRNEGKPAFLRISADESGGIEDYVIKDLDPQIYYNIEVAPVTSAGVSDVIFKTKVKTKGMKNSMIGIIVTVTAIFLAVIVFGSFKIWQRSLIDKDMITVPALPKDDDDKDEEVVRRYRKISKNGHIPVAVFGSPEKRHKPGHNNLLTETTSTDTTGIFSIPSNEPPMSSKDTKTYSNPSLASDKNYLNGGSAVIPVKTVDGYAARFRDNEVSKLSEGSGSSFSSDYSTSSNEYNDDEKLEDLKNDQKPDLNTGLKSNPSGDNSSGLGSDQSTIEDSSKDVHLESRQKYSNNEIPLDSCVLNINNSAATPDNDTDDIIINLGSDCSGATLVVPASDNYYFQDDETKV